MIYGTSTSRPFRTRLEYRRLKARFEFSQFPSILRIGIRNALLLIPHLIGTICFLIEFGKIEGYPNVHRIRSGIYHRTGSHETNEIIGRRGSHQTGIQDDLVDVWVNKYFFVAVNGVLFSLIQLAPSALVFRPI